MNYDIKLNGTQEFMGKEIPVVYGGFGDNCKVILAKTIAEIHGILVGEINRNITNNIKRFKDGVDIVDLKQMGDVHTFSNLGFTKAQWGNANNIYLLSERGYVKLIKIMDSDLAWEVHDKLVDEYFSMRERLENQIPQLTEKQQLQLKILNGGDMERIEALRQYENVITKPLLETIEQQEVVIEEQKPCVDYVEAVSAQKDSILVRQVCKIAFTKGHIEIGERKLYNLLRHWKLICLHSTEPTQKALNSDYLEVETKLIDTMYGKKEVFTTLVKPKGQVYIVQKLANLTIDEVNTINKEINEKRR